MLVNVGVLVSGTAIALTGYRVIDLLTSAAISIFVIHEGDRNLARRRLNAIRESEPLYTQLAARSRRA